MRKILVLLAVLACFAFIGCKTETEIPPTKGIVVDANGGIMREKYSTITLNSEKMSLKEILEEINDCLFRDSDGPEDKPYLDKVEINGKVLTFDEVMRYDFKAKDSINVKMFWTATKNKIIPIAYYNSEYIFSHSFIKASSVEELNSEISKIEVLRKGYTFNHWECHVNENGTFKPVKNTELTKEEFENIEAILSIWDKILVDVTLDYNGAYYIDDSEKTAIENTISGVGVDSDEEFSDLVEFILDNAEIVTGPGTTPYLDKVEIDEIAYTLNELMAYDLTKPVSVKLLWGDVKPIIVVPYNDNDYSFDPVPVIIQSNSVEDLITKLAEIGLEDGEKYSFEGWKTKGEDGYDEVSTITEVMPYMYVYPIWEYIY